MFLQEVVLLIKSETLPEVVIRLVIQYMSDSTLYIKKYTMKQKLSKLFIRQQLDESTDVANVAQNFVFNRYADQPRGLVVRASGYYSRSPGFDSRLYHGDFPCGGRIPVVTIVWVVSRFRLIYEEPNINQQCLNLRDLLAGGDLIMLGSLQVRLPDSQHIRLQRIPCTADC